MGVRSAPGHVTHGLACYWAGCRCDVGRTAWRRYQRRHKALQRKAEAMGMSLTVPSVGPRRRIQALVAQGWNMDQISAACGHHRRSVEDILRGRNKRTGWAYAQAIRLAYDELWDQEPPEGRSRTYVRNMARKRGYAPPMAWDDDSIDDPLAEPHQGTPVDIDWLQVARAVAGKPRGRRLTKQERRAAAEVMALRGASASAISKTLGLSGSDAQTVIREVAA